MKRNIIPIILLMILISSNLSADSFNDGIKHHKNKNYKEAVNSYASALKDDPNNVMLHSNMGNAFFEMEDYKKSLESYQNAMNVLKDKGEERSKISAEVYYNISMAYYYNDQVDEALKSIEESLKINPDDKDSKYNWYVIKNAVDSKGGSNVNPNSNDQNNQNSNKQNDQGENKNQNQDENNKDDKKDPNRDNRDNGDDENQDDNGNKNDGNRDNKKLPKEERDKFLNEMKNREMSQRKHSDIKSKGDPGNISTEHEKDW